MAKLTAAQIKEQTRKIQEEIEKQRRRLKTSEQNFTALSPEEIDAKLKRVKSPMIVFQGWSGAAAPGGTINYSVGVWNPDPTPASNLFVHVWVGSGNVDPTTGTFLLNVDPRFPRLTEPPFFGATIAPSTSVTLTYALKVPAGVDKSNYLGNSCLMQFNWHDVGQYLDRGVFPFQVT